MLRTIFERERPFIVNRLSDNRMKALYKILVLVVCLSLAVACGKEEPDYVIPASLVNFKVDVNNADNSLKTPGNIKSFTAARLAGEYVGYSGLLVFSSLVQEKGVGLYAFDLCCPYEKDKNVTVQPSIEDGTATCSKCKSVFDLRTGIGNKISGPSTTGLQQYKVSKESSTVFRIYR